MSRERRNFGEADGNNREPLEGVTIEAVVFDVGDVLFQGDRGGMLDNRLIRKLSLFFKCSDQDVSSAFEVLHNEGMTGSISKKEYLERFWIMCGKEPVQEIEELQKPFINPDICQPSLRMQDIVKKLSQNPNIRLFVFSNVIAACVPVLIQRLKECYPEIPEQNYLFSSYLGFGKGIDNALAFSKLLEAVRPSSPHAVIFIDNTENYVEAASKFCNITGIHFCENQAENLSAEDVLIRELQGLGLIQDRHTCVSHEKMIQD